MHVHFVSVKIGVVRGGHGEVESEGLTRENLDPVTHEGHFMERGLSVKNDKIIVI